ncbi:MAG: hypothetical protein ACKVQW_15690 [Pyrinomonadaceae bacterium]
MMQTTPQRPLINIKEKMMSEEIEKHIAATHELLTKHFIDSAKKQGKTAPNAQSWSASAVGGSITNFLVYFSVNLTLNFSPIQTLNFSASGTTIGFGGLSVDAGSATFFVDPAQLIGAQDIACFVAGVAAGPAVATVTWLQHGTPIGIGTFTGVGVLTLPPPYNIIPGNFT